MRIGTFMYCLKQGIVNICRNIWFSLASTAIISACIFLLCMFYSIIRNIQYMVFTAETTMGITIFFDEALAETEILEIGETIKAERAGQIKEMLYVSAEEAWETFQTDYFGENMALAAGFSDDNPLAGSASYEIFLKEITGQADMVRYLETLPGVRRVNYSNHVAAGLASFNRILAMLFGAILAILLAVAVFLISNTITVAAEFRKDENRIMRLIGAANFMIRAPFVVEGLILGLVGAALPLTAVYYLYRQTVEYVAAQFGILSGIIQFLPIHAIYPTMLGISLTLGGGLGFIVSSVTIRRHLRV
ncbi:MAG: ABC transporter permease [Lachnospiraceae bacterium]|jgi:cell division transport system permease protein|nr:ABC transporter permease [Lachnospiraceae bacterium]